MFKKKKTYIEHKNTNSMWNDGIIYVYVKDELKETIFVDEYLLETTDENILGVYDIIEMLKEKYSIEKVVVEEDNWR